MGFFGSVFIILSNIGVIVRLQAKLRHRLWHYLLNGGFLIILLAIAEGMLGFVLYKSSMNTAIFGPNWGSLTNFSAECNTTAQVIQFSVWLELLSVMFLGASFYEILHNCRNITPRLCVIYVASALVGSTLMTVLPSITDSYGPLPLWCWISAAGTVQLAGNVTQSSADLQWAYYYAELFIAVITLVVITMIPLRNWATIKKDPSKKQLAVRMILFPVVWLLCKFPALIDRAYQLFTGDVVDGLTFAHAITIPAVGFADALAYAATSAKMQEFFTSLKFQISTSTKLRSSLLKRPGVQRRSGRDPASMKSTRTYAIEPPDSKGLSRDAAVSEMLEKVALDPRFVQLHELIGHSVTGLLSTVCHHAIRPPSF